MFCQVCGNEVTSLLAPCARCKQSPQSGRNFCHNCGNATNPAAVICTSCGAALTPPTQSNPYISSGENRPQPQAAPFSNQSPYQNPSGAPGIASANNNKVPAGILGILMGTFGIHKFILGYNTEGLIMLLVSTLGFFVTCGLSTAVMGVIGLIEGIIYLTKTDDDFINTYVVNKRGWF